MRISRIIYTYIHIYVYLYMPLTTLKPYVTPYCLQHHSIVNSIIAYVSEYYYWAIDTLPWTVDS